MQYRNKIRYCLFHLIFHFYNHFPNILGSRRYETTESGLADPVVFSSFPAILVINFSRHKYTPQVPSIKLIYLVTAIERHSYLYEKMVFLLMEPKEVIQFLRQFEFLTLTKH